MVLARRKARAHRLQEREARRNASAKSKGITKDKAIERERSSERQKEKERERIKVKVQAALQTSQLHNVTISTNASQGIENHLGNAGAKENNVVRGGKELDLERQTPRDLAMAVRRHFNSQQVGEQDVVGRFCYVVRHSHGQGVDVGDGDAGGFRLRFRP